MSIKNVLEVGLKVVLALGAGFAMFMGVNESIKRSNQSSSSNTESSSDEPVCNDKATGTEKGRSIVNGLRAAQSTCGKLLSLTQGLVTIAESISTLSCTGGEYYERGGYYTPYQGGGGHWRRVNPFIVESVPSGAPINYNNQYPC